MGSYDAIILVVHGAYGREYEHWEACKADWDAGKDFKVLGGPYCSIRDVEKMKEMGVRTVFFVSGSALPIGHIVLHIPVNGDGRLPPDA